MKQKNYLSLIAFLIAFISIAGDMNAQCTSYSYPGTAYKCKGTAYNFYGRQIITPGVYEDTIAGAALGGCDSVIQQLIGDYPTPIVDFYDTICAGQTFTIGTHTYTTTGLDTIVLFQSVFPFCDSDIVIHLYVRPSHNDTIHLSASGCVTRIGGGPGGGRLVGGYVFFGDTLRVTGDYYHSSPSAVLCSDTVYALSLTIGQASTAIQNIGICTSGSYTINGHTYTTQGNYRDTMTSVAGCDSIVVTRLTVTAYVQPAATAASFCTGSSYTWRGHTYTTASPTGFGGGYKDTTHTASSACDTIFTLNLTAGSYIQPAADNGTLCQGGTYTWRGHSYTQIVGFGTRFYDTVAAVGGGCDTVFTLNLRVGFPPQPTTKRDSFCYGSSYTYRGVSFTTSGRDTLYSGAANGGCDSTFILILTYKAAPTIAISDSFCQGSRYIYGTDTFTTSGTYPVSARPAPSGCDTVVALTLTYKSAPSYTYRDSFCQGSTYLFRGSSFTTTGNHTVTVASPSGCDTVITLILSHKSAPRRTVTASICAGGIYVYGTDTFTARGQYTITVPAPTGCDSVLTVRINQIPNPRIFVNDTICAGTVFHYGTDTTGYTTAGRYTLTVPSRTGGCDTTVTINIVLRASAIANPISVNGSSLTANGSGTNLSYQWYLNDTTLIIGATSQFYTPTQSGNYSVEISDGINCPKRSASHTVSTGINDLASDFFKLYPNPNIGKFTVETVNYSGTEISVYDVYGRLVFQKALSSGKEMIDMSSAVNGTYYLVMKNQQYSKYAHFVIAQ